MPDGGPRGPRDGGFFGHNYTLRDAQSYIDRRRTFGRPPAQGGLVGGGYVAKNTFSIIDLWHRFQLAQTFSLRRPAGVSRFGAFVGNWRVLSQQATRKARLDEMAARLTAAYNDYRLDDDVYGGRIMYEAHRYYGWLRDNYRITEEEYRTYMTDFADKHGIEYDFGDSAPVMSR